LGRTVVVFSGEESDERGNAFSPLGIVFQVVTPSIEGPVIGKSRKTSLNLIF
jgi:hypothetical protein